MSITRYTITKDSDKDAKKLDKKATDLFGVESSDASFTKETADASRSAGHLAIDVGTANAFSIQTVTASFVPPILTTTGDNLNNTIELSRDAAGKILVNGGAVTIPGGTPTVANTSLMQVFGLGGDDIITLNQANGALPRANLFGGTGNDSITGGSGADMLFGHGA
jgi:Ca2+-binding RTX toxin-like protein